MRKNRTQLDVTQKKPNLGVDSRITYDYPVYEMAPQKQAEVINIRPNAEDNALFAKLRQKLGIGNSQIIRLALRRLAEAEGLQLKVS